MEALMIPKIRPYYVRVRVVVQVSVLSCGVD